MTAASARPRIDWRRVFVEGTVIVVSILLAFAIDAWWDGRKDRAAERQLLASIERDLLDSRSELLRVMEFQQTHGVSLDRFVDASPAELAVLAEDSARFMLRRFLLTATFQPFDAALRARDLSVITDPRIREGVLSWLAHSEDVLENNAMLTEAFGAVSHAGGLNALAIRTGRTSLQRQSAAATLAEWRRDDRVIAELLRKESIESNTERKAARLLEITDELLALLRAES